MVFQKVRGICIRLVPGACLQGATFWWGGGETSECLCILCVSLFKIDLTFQSGCRVTAKSSQKYRVPVHCLSPTPRPVRAVFTARFEDALALTATHARATHSLGERP